MKFSILLIISVLFCGNIHSQSISGNYIGKKQSATTYEYNKKGKRVNEQVEYEKKNLMLKEDGTFSFDYFKLCGFCTSQGGKSKSCTGSWKLVKDTLYLTSTYAEEDFIEVKESFVPTKEKQLLKIFNRSTYDDDEEDSLYVNGVLKIIETDTTEDWYVGRMGVRIASDITSVFFYDGITCGERDTVYFKGKAPLKMTISAEEAYSDIKCHYVSKDSTANCFDIKVKRTIKGENMWFKNVKMIIVNGELHPTLDRYTNSELSVEADRPYRKQKEPQKK